MNDPKPLKSIWRKVWEPRNTKLGIGAWAWPYLDKDHWWMDSWKTDAWRYLHCLLVDGPGFEADDRVTRVYPREKKGRTVVMGMRSGELYWIYSHTVEELATWNASWATAARGR